MTSEGTTLVQNVLSAQSAVIRLLARTVYTCIGPIIYRVFSLHGIIAIESKRKHVLVYKV